MVPACLGIRGSPVDSTTYLNCVAAPMVLASRSARTRKPWRMDISMPYAPATREQPRERLDCCGRSHSFCMFVRRGASRVVRRAHRAAREMTVAPCGAELQDTPHPPIGTFSPLTRGEGYSRSELSRDP